MSQRQRREKREKKRMAILARRNGSCLLQPEAIARLQALSDSATPGMVNHVGIFHSMECATFQRRGARECTCIPEIKLLDPNDARDAKVLRSQSVQEAQNYFG